MCLVFAQQHCFGFVLLSRSLHKTVQPSSVYVAVKTEYGVYRSDAAALFEGVNTITVDLASDEFSLQSDTAPAFDEPIVGLSRVQAIVVHLVATEAGAVSATLADAVVCAAAPSTADDAAAAATVTYTDAKDAALAYPDVASLSAALTAALQSANQLQAEIGEIKEAQRRAERGFDQFAARSRESLEHSVTAISEALQASVKQSSANSHLLKQAMSSVRATLDEHSARIEQLEASFASLRTLQVAPAEKLSEAVARTNAAAAADVDAPQPQAAASKRAGRHHQQAKRSVDVDAPRVAAAAASHVVKDGFHVAGAAAKKSLNKRVVIPSP